MSVRVYVEGGGNQRELKAKSRRAFKAFFEKRLKGKMPKVIPCGTREETYKNFCISIAKARDGDFTVLLVDSEDPVADGSATWSHLKKRGNHSFAILAELNPEKVIAASPHARRLFETLVEKAG